MFFQPNEENALTNGAKERVQTSEEKKSGFGVSLMCIGFYSKMVELYRATNQPPAPAPGYRGRDNPGGKRMFKKFIERIIAAKDRQDAIDNVFYGTVWKDGTIIQWGIDIAYQYDKITWKEHQMLFNLINKMA